ncbi:MAG TPA: hypothetical protein VK817_00180 [Trebonia sp.]|jgi:hypothetical protein|nr:hypothetical protein [Trebonia sp.]
MAQTRIHGGPVPDRRAVVSRHDVVLSQPDENCPVQVGNGDFAFNADVTGLQTCYGNTLSSWGWHSAPLPAGLRPEDRERTPVVTNGRTRYYLAPHRQDELAGWLYDNPHRLNLGRLYFARGTGEALEPGDIDTPRQRLDLWRGAITSAFTSQGAAVETTTVCHPELSIVAVRVRSELLAAGRLKIALGFGYPVPNWGVPYLSDWGRPTGHATDVLGGSPGRIRLRRVIDDTVYHCDLRADGARIEAAAPHVVTVVSGGPVVDVICRFSPEPLSGRAAGELPSFDETAAAAASYWESFWTHGAAIDLSASADPRWRELERRIVLSQYLTAVNSAGAAPPQESGLLLNSWYGKFHLEMTAWHGAHFMLWDRPGMLEGWFAWLRGTGLAAARAEALAEGWRGAKWLKTPDPYGRWESWEYGPRRITQNAHPLYFAELAYRAEPTAGTLAAWRDVVFETADMMADFAGWEHAGQRYVLGPPVLSGAEGDLGDDGWNPTSELNYWAWSLETAQRWRERLGLPRDQWWEQVRTRLSSPPVVDGVYIDAESHPERWDVAPEGSWPLTGRWACSPGPRHLRPAWLEVYGCIRGPLIDPAVLTATYERIAAALRGSDQVANIWGTDFPMLAMTAARLGRPDEAVDWLLADAPRNQYSAAGFSNGWYLPGNGGLLWAVAMMTAGWGDGPADGTGSGPGGDCPGWPDDGSWTVRHEGFRPAP